MRPWPPPDMVWPDHPLRGEPDGSHASWWLDGLVDDWGRIDGFLPGVFPAVAVLLHPYTGPDGEPLSWQAVADAWGVTRRRLPHAPEGTHAPWMQQVGPGSWTSVDGAPHDPPEELPRTLATALLPHLAAATTTPDDVFVGRWVGFGGEALTTRFAPCAVVDTPHRGHALLRGPLDGVLTSVHHHAAGAGECVGGIWWPADRAWAVHTEVDGWTTEVAGSEALIEALLADPALEGFATTFDRDSLDDL